MDPDRTSFTAIPARLLLLCCWVLMVLNPTFAETPENPKDQEIAELKAMIRALEARVSALESSRESENMAGLPRAPGEVYSAAPWEESEIPEEYRNPLSTSKSGAERKETEGVLALSESLPPPIIFKGALRYNWFLTDSNSDSKRGQSGLDLFRVGAEGSVRDFLISAEYRFYPYMNTLHHGWVGYEDPQLGQFQLGVSRVPFGILPYAAHNYWFGVPYYMGFADDYDLGLKWIRDAGPWNFQAAFYKNAELGDASNLDRISFDLVQTSPDQANEEINQLNLRIARTFGTGTSSVHELGLSLQGGEIYNSVTDRTGDHWAVGVHMDTRIRRWNFQVEALRYAFNPENPVGVSEDRVRLGGFASSYEVSASGTIGVFNVAYNVPVEVPWLDSLLLYNNYSILVKDAGGGEESMLNTTGAAVGIGPLFLYFDLIQGRNMIFFEDGSLAGGGNETWDQRLNINLGYYW